MQTLLHQLEHTRDRARSLMWLYILLPWLSSIWLLLPTLALFDFIFRLPSWLRLIVGLTTLLLLVSELLRRIQLASMFFPTLESLALRLERLYPQVKDQLASVVEFYQPTVASDTSNTSTTRAMMHASESALRERMDGIEVGKLLETGPTLRRLAFFVLAFLVLAACIFTMPEASKIAAQRWVLPFSDVAWPKRVQLQAIGAPATHATDEPFPFRVNVERGQHADLSVRASYRYIRPDGHASPWQVIVLNRVSSSDKTDTVRYEQVLELPPTPTSMDLNHPQTHLIEWYYHASDDQTAVQQAKLIDRPSMTRLNVTITPPSYAADFVPVREVAMLEHSSRTTSLTALQGSTLTLLVETSKPVRLDHESLQAMWPGLENVTLEQSTRQGDDSTLSRRFVLQLPLEKTMQSPVMFIDTYGLGNNSDRIFRFDAQVDSLPTVSLTQPRSDLSVLATANVPLAAEARDGVGLAELGIYALFPREDETSEAGPSELLAMNRMRQTSLRLEASLNLNRYDIRPGNVIEVYALAQDVYEQEGQSRDPVQSNIRKIQIVDEETFISQVRQELGHLRRQADRLRDQQASLQEQMTNPQVNLQQMESRQRALNERIARQEAFLDTLQDRIRMNQLDNAVVLSLFDETDALLSRAQQHATEARESLEQAASMLDDPDAQIQAREQAQQAQAETEQSLEELVRLLDQGQDVAVLQAQARQMREQQNMLREQAHELLPQVVGRTLEDLPENVRDALEQLGNAQDALSDQARELMQQMQNTAQRLQQEESDRDQAAAASLAEAAAIAQQQGLDTMMREAAEQVQQNRLSQAGSAQQQSLDTLDQMLSELGQQQQRMEQQLRRRLEELAQAINRLIRDQQAKLARTHAIADDDRLAPLEPRQMQLRRSTLAVEQDANRAEGASHIARLLHQAAGFQGDAAVHMREQEKPSSQLAQQRAIEHLQEALDAVQQMQQDTAEREAREQRNALRKAYARLAREQQTLIHETQEAWPTDPPDRATRLKMMQLSTEQMRIRQEMSDLGDQVRELEAIVFTRMHEMLDERAQRTVQHLRQIQQQAQVAIDQQTISRILLSLAEALRQQEDDSPFSSGLGGSGGGGGDAPVPVLPKLAELRLLREIQITLRDQTQNIDEQQIPDQNRDAQLTELAQQQAELAALGEQLLEKAKEHMTPNLQPDNEGANEFH